MSLEGKLPNLTVYHPGMLLAFCVPWVPTSLLTAWRRDPRKFSGETHGSPPNQGGPKMYIKNHKDVTWKKIQLLVQQVSRVGCVFSGGQENLNFYGWSVWFGLFWFAIIFCYKDRMVTYNVQQDTFPKICGAVDFQPGFLGWWKILSRKCSVPDVVPRKEKTTTFGSLQGKNSVVHLLTKDESL